MREGKGVVEDPSLVGHMGGGEGRQSAWMDEVGK